MARGYNFSLVVALTFPINQMRDATKTSPGTIVFGYSPQHPGGIRLEVIYKRENKPGEQDDGHYLHVKATQDNTFADHPMSQIATTSTSQKFDVLVCHVMG